MPYRRTKSLSKGRREEKEKQLNTHRPIKSGIDSSSAAKVGGAQNAFSLAKSLAGVRAIANGGHSRQPSTLNIFLDTCHPECRLFASEKSGGSNVAINSGHSHQPFAEPTTKDLSLLIAQAKGVAICS